jgi:hypothetical protein
VGVKFGLSLYKGRSWTEGVSNMVLRRIFGPKGNEVTGE